MNKHIIFRSACFVTIALSSISLSKAFAETTPPKQVTSVEGITEYQLDNGLRVLLYPDASRPTVTVNMMVLVGSRHEGYGETGMAHLLEHMVFKGTDAPERSQGASGSRRPVQRHDFGRSHELLRNASCQR